MWGTGLHTVVCIKQVPKTLDVCVDPVTHNLIRQGMESVINMFDENALEEALLLREKFGGKVSVISMGPPQVQEALRKAVAMGADEAYLLCDRALGGADVLATAYTLAQGIKKLQPVDLILCGRHAVDADTGQGAGAGRTARWPQVTLVKRLSLMVPRSPPGGLTRTAVWEPLPAVVTVGKEINKPRYQHRSVLFGPARNPLLSGMPRT